MDDGARFGIDMKSILITGGSGALGHALVGHMLKVAPYVKRIVVLSRGEFRQFTMSQRFKNLDIGDRMRYMIGDVRDRKRLQRAMQGIEVVIHAAALKRIEVGHYNPVEMVKTNVDGALNVIEAAQDAGVRKVIGVSSDKAFQPVSPYGTSKAMAESAFLAADNITGGITRFAVCRYGNVWNSTGSVVPVWRKMIADGEEVVPVTDPECTRFFMKMSEAVNLIFETAAEMKGGELKIPILPAYRLGDLAEAMRVDMKIIGLPPWEKLHESMALGNSSDKTRRMSVAELREQLLGTEGA